MKTIKGKRVGRKKKPVYKSIFGDYDVDGATSSALLASALR